MENKIKVLKRTKTIIIFVFIISLVSIDCSKQTISTITLNAEPVKVAVFLYDLTDDFISEIRQNLENIQNENQGKIEYTFYDAKSNQAIQTESINKVLNEGIDLILLNIVNIQDSQTIINKIKVTNTPVILFNREPITPAPIQSYAQALYIGTDGQQAGMLQGKMLVDAWDTSKEYIDRNKDNIMQYVMLEGEIDSKEAIQRTQYSVSSINDAGIITELLTLEVCDWREDLAYVATQRAFLLYNDSIDVIISNDDTMAIGAIKALQEFGYNKGNLSKTIPVVGVDVTPEAKDLIEKGFMLGSVYQSPKEYAEALYTCGMNLVNGKSPIYGTKYQLDDTRVSIRLPITDYLYKNMFPSISPEAHIIRKWKIVAPTDCAKT